MGDKMRLRLIENWKRRMWRLPRVYVALFWGAVSGLLLVWPTLAEAVPFRFYVFGGMAISAALDAIEAVVLVGYCFLRRDPVV